MIQENFFQSEITFITLLCGVIFILAGGMVYFFPPKNINGLYGYRTAKSRKSQENWDFAQIYAAKKTMLLGVFLSVVGILAGFVTIPDNLQIIAGLAVFISACIYLIVSTEKALKQKFKSI